MVPLKRLSSAQRVHLDFARAAAALLVLFGHAAQLFLPGSLLARGQAQGIGVLVFFLISGFLISLSVLQKRAERNYGLAQYFIDRFCRIYCAFLPALILVLVVDGLVADDPGYAWRHDYNLPTWFGNLLMLQDFPAFQILRRLGVPEQSWFVSSFGSGRQFWTISIEWWIYMLFGGIVLVWLRRGRLGLAGGLVLAFVAGEPLYHLVGGYDECLTALWIVGFAASLLFLRLPALAARDKRLTLAGWRRLWLAAASAGALAMAVRLFANGFEIAELQFSLFLATALFGSFFALGTWRGAVPAAVERLVGFLAGYSYSLYLTHYTLLEFLRVRFPGAPNDPGAFWLAILAANLLAIAFWWLFERHHRRLADWAKTWLVRHRGTIARHGSAAAGSLTRQSIAPARAASRARPNLLTDLQ